MYSYETLAHSATVRYWRVIAFLRNFRSLTSDQKRAFYAAFPWLDARWVRLHDPDICARRYSAKLHCRQCVGRRVGDGDIDVSSRRRRRGGIGRRSLGKKASVDPCRSSGSRCLRVLSGFSTSYAMLFACRALFGIGMGGEWAAGMPLALEHLPDRMRGPALGHSSGCLGVGVCALCSRLSNAVSRFSRAHGRGLAGDVLGWLPFLPFSFFGSGPTSPRARFGSRVRA